MAVLPFASTLSQSSVFGSSRFASPYKFPQILGLACTSHSLALRNTPHYSFNHSSLQLHSNWIYRNPFPLLSGQVIVRASQIAVSERDKELSEEIKSGPKLDSTGGGGGGGGGDKFGGGGGGGEGEGEGEGGGRKEEGKQMALSMSQKLTLGYAALLGVGGLIGYVKRRSSMSLISGGLSALVLYYVHTQLPTNPVFASSVGLGISAVVLTLMGARFRASGTIFPAGVVSLVSLIMTGGYLHGILRSSHA